MDHSVCVCVCVPVCMQILNCHFNHSSGYCLYLFPRASITKCYKLGNLRIQEFVLSQLWRPDSKIEMSARLVSSGGSKVKFLQASLLASGDG